MCCDVFEGRLTKRKPTKRRMTVTLKKATEAPEGRGVERLRWSCIFVPTGKLHQSYSDDQCSLQKNMDNAPYKCVRHVTFFLPKSQVRKHGSARKVQ